MKYYKAKKEVYNSETGYSTIVNELLTEMEFKNFFPNFNTNIFDIVEISSHDTYFFFGARFQIEK